MTAFFGLGMVLIGNSLDPMEGSGATLMVKIARQLETTFGRVGPLVKWSFLVGAWAAVFTSLLGVWQSIPYLFADLWQHITNRRGKYTQIDTRSRCYRGYLYAIAFVPIIGLVGVDFRAMMKVYAVVGALFIPMLVPVLLILNGRARFIGEQYKNSWPTTAVLIGVLVLFALVGTMEVRDSFFAPTP
jgi:hypothetical protein